jgi:hypothetical protein
MYRAGHFQKPDHNSIVMPRLGRGIHAFAQIEESKAWTPEPSSGVTARWRKRRYDPAVTFLTGQQWIPSLDPIFAFDRQRHRCMLFHIDQPLEPYFWVNPGMAPERCCVIRWGKLDVVPT